MPWHDVHIRQLALIYTAGICEAMRMHTSKLAHLQMVTLLPSEEKLPVPVPMPRPTPMSACNTAQHLHSVPQVLSAHGTTSRRTLCRCWTQVQHVKPLT